MATIKLKSSDEQLFNVDVKVAQQSMTIKTMLDELGFSKEEEEEPIPLPNINGSILKKVIEWASYHKDDLAVPEDENAEKRCDDISEWDQQFLKIDKNTLFDLILAANYLDIRGLLEVTCKTVANMIKGKTPEQIRMAFKLDEKQEISNSEPKLLKEEYNEDQPKKLKNDSSEEEIKKVKQEAVIEPEKEKEQAIKEESKKVEKQVIEEEAKKDKQEIEEESGQTQ